MTGALFPAGTKIFLCSVQRGSGVHSAPQRLGTGGAMLEPYHFRPSCVEVKNGGAMPQLPLHLHDVVLNYLIHYA
jgi:hypothetical protein